MTLNLLRQPSEQNHDCLNLSLSVNCSTTAPIFNTYVVHDQNFLKHECSNQEIQTILLKLTDTLYAASQLKQNFADTRLRPVATLTGSC